MNASRRPAIAPALLSIVVMAVAAPALAGPRLGIEGGLRYAELTREADPPFDFGPSSKYRPSWSVGAVVDQSLGPVVSVASGLRYVENIEKFTIQFVSTGGGGSSTTYRFNTRIAFRSVELPVRVGVRPFRSGFLLEGSGGVSYLLEAVAKTGGSYAFSGTPQLRYAQIFEEVGVLGDDQTKYYRRWNAVTGRRHAPLALRARTQRHRQELGRGPAHRRVRAPGRLALVGADLRRRERAVKLRRRFPSDPPRERACSKSWARG